MALGRVTDGLHREAEEATPGLVPRLDDRVAFVAAGDCLSIALSAEGKVYAWGTFNVSCSWLWCIHGHQFFP